MKINIEYEIINDLTNKRCNYCLFKNLKKARQVRRDMLKIKPYLRSHLFLYKTWKEEYGRYGKALD